MYELKLRFEKKFFPDKYIACYGGDTHGSSYIYILLGSVLFCVISSNIIVA